MLDIEITTDDLLAPFQVYSALPLGLPAYYNALSKSSDEILRVGAYAALLDLMEIRRDQWDEIVDLSIYGAIRIRAANFFRANYNYDYVDKVLSKSSPPEAHSLGERRLRADIALDYEALLEIERQAFLEEGRIESLRAASINAEFANGWKPSAQWLIRAVVLGPMEATSATSLCKMLLFANQYEYVQQLIQLFNTYKLYPTVRTVFAAALALQAGDAKACLRLSQSVQTDRARPVESYLLGLRASACEKLERYRDAYNWYLRQNKATRNPNIDPTHFTKQIERRIHTPIPALPDDPRTDFHMMVGFPRSGTTLLENALATHPLIETFEEIPSMSSAQAFYDRGLSDAGLTEDSVEAGLEARRRYYNEIDRRRSKKDAVSFVDKLPIRSGEAAMLVKLFPKKKYIFSVRHPFDVVLSCFKQDFKPNVAMANFHTIPDAIRVYDFVMKQWFSVYSMDDERVHYLRYDELVTDFEKQTRRVCDFLGVPWDSKMLGFAEAAETRKVKTPSYQKVRSGLQIGVQSSWQNYRFLFETREAEPLRKWVEFFGYDTN